MKEKYKILKDEKLMHLIRSKDNMAFEELYDRYSKKMFNFFYYSFHADKQKAEDFLQNIFLKIIKKPELFNTEKKFSTWFFAVASNMCKNEFRAIQNDKISGSVNENVIIHAESIFSPNHRDLKKELYNALDSLKPMNKQIMILRYKENMSINEISNILNIPEGTVKSKIFYSIKKLRGRLNDFKNIEIRTKKI